MSVAGMAWDAREEALRMAAELEAGAQAARTLGSRLLDLADECVIEPGPWQWRGCVGSGSDEYPVEDRRRWDRDRNLWVRFRWGPVTYAPTTASTAIDECTADEALEAAHV